MISRKKRQLSLLFTVMMVFSIWLMPNERAYANTSLPSISSSKYISTYTYSSSGKIYAYREASLKNKTGGYIACATDECRILEINGKAVKVSYPVSGGRKTAWFLRDEFTYRNLAEDGAKLRFTSNRKVTTYKWKNKGNTFGYIVSGDVCYLLRGDSSSDWLQVIYPTGNTFKMAWVKGGEIRDVIWPPKNSASTSKGGESVYKAAKSLLGKKYSQLSGYGFTPHAWCADFVSWCAQNAGQSKAVPKNSAVSNLWTAIKHAGGKEYSKDTVKSGDYTPVKGDVIIFKSCGASHTGIVDYAKNGTIYYIDGNNITNGNGNNSCVHYSNCSYSYSKLTCVLHPNYK